MTDSSSLTQNLSMRIPFMPVVQGAQTGSVRLLDRDHGILAFNARVLDWAQREEVPLLERLRFLCIVSSNLDEFFEVRAIHHLLAAKTNDHKGHYTVASFEDLASSTHQLVATQYEIYNQALIPALAKHRIKIISHGQRNAQQRLWVKEYFESEVRPLLIPVSLDPAHPFPQVANKSLNFIVRLSGRNAFGRTNEIAIVKVPRLLPRLIRIPNKRPGREAYFVSLSSVIRAHLEDLFPERGVSEFSHFRITRHSELAVDEEESKNLRTALRQGLQHRHYGQAVRLEVSADCSVYLKNFLLHQFDLPEAACYAVHGPVNLVRFSQLADMVDAPRLLFAPYQPRWPVDLTPPSGSFFDRLKQGDVLIHQPYESFDAVMAFLHEAVYDPNVLAIRQTIYRTGADVTLLNLLREAVRRGKEVTVVVELKARFDEETNIHSAEMLEAIGAQVLYGVVGLKTHAKILLVTRREGKDLRRYVHLSTGNYNARTARLYTDLSHLSANPQLTAEVEKLFLHVASQTKLPKLQTIWAAPFTLRTSLLEKIQAVAQAAKRGLGGRIVLKVNSMTDEPLIEALLQAGECGAQIDLLVRGACMLPAQLPGVSEHIRVRSIVGRFLEHSRVFYFRAGEQEDLYLSSADCMSRSMTRRIELAWPVTEPALRQRLIDECLLAYLYDTQDAWDLQADGSYLDARLAHRPHHANDMTHSAQEALMTRYKKILR